MRQTMILLPCLLALTAGSIAQGTDGEPDVLAALYFYKSYHVGKTSPATGLLRRRAGESDWHEMAWRELITSSVTVDASGRWIYLGCGNGVMVSRDAGQTWCLTGGAHIAEVQRMLIDPEDPKHAWAATAWGLFEAADITAESPWVQIPTQAFRFCSDVVLDARGELIVATERGVFTTLEGGKSFVRLGTDLRVRRLLLDHSYEGRVLAATDGQGLLESSLFGLAWERVPGLPDTLLCVEPDPEEPGAVVVGGMGEVWRYSKGKTVQVTGAGLPAGYHVYDLLVDQRGTITASGTDGIFVLPGMDTAGSGLPAWQRVAFENALVPDMTRAYLAEVEPSPLWTGGGTLALVPAGEEESPAQGAAFDERAHALLAALAPGAERDPETLGFFDVLVASRSGTATPAHWDAVAKRLEDPQHSMFFSLPLMALYLHCREQMPAELSERIRAVMTGNPVYRGDTENHWVMGYAALMLATETWPETPAEEWYTGRTTQSLHDECRQWLDHWIDLTARLGQGEFDSPNYIFMFVTPLLLLHDFAAEEEVRRMAGMALDLLLADYLVESVGGIYGGGHSRDPKPLLVRREPAAGYHYLYAGGIDRPENVHGWLAVAACSDYRPPALLAGIGNDRRVPYVHTEVKRVRNVLRFGDGLLNPPVYKVDYVTADYCLGSLQGGILQPIQQHTWDVSWKSDRGDNATFFAVHPFVSARELAMFFPEELHYTVASVSAQKGMYVDERKLVSSSPYEKVVQHENVLLALYQVPVDQRYPHVNVHLPHCLDRRDTATWSFGRDGDFYFAWYTTEPGGDYVRSADHELLQLPGQRLGIAVVTRPAPVAGRDSYEVFQELLLSRAPPELTGEGDSMTLTCTGPGGETVRATWGEPAPFPTDQLFAGPFLSGRVGEKVITLTDGRTRRILDFNSMTARDEPVEGR